MAVQPDFSDEELTKIAISSIDELIARGNAQLKITRKNLMRFYRRMDAFCDAVQKVQNNMNALVERRSRPRMTFEDYRKLWSISPSREEEHGEEAQNGGSRSSQQTAAPSNQR